MNRLQALTFLILSSMAATVWANSDRLEIEIAPAKYEFTTGGVLSLDRDAKLAPEEFELSQQLRPLLQQGNYAAAYDVTRSAATPRSAALDLLAAQLLGVLGRYTEAIPLYQAAIDKMPQLTRAHAGLGTLYLLTDNLEAARASLARAVAYGAADVQTFAQLAYLNQNLANPWSAINAYQQALMLEPDNAQWQFGLLTVLIAAGNHSSAGALLDELLSASPQNISLWQQRANLAMKQNDTLRAVSSLEAAIRLGDETSGNRLAAAQLHMDHGNLSRATELLQQNLRQSQMDPEDIFPVVQWLLSRGATNEADRLIGELIRNNRNWPPRQSSLVAEMQGLLALAQNKTRDGVRLLSQAVSADASNARALMRLARLRLEQDQLARAAILFERAETVPGHEKPALLGRAQVAIERGQYTQALDLVRQIQKRFPGSYELDSYIRSLANLSTATGTAP
ncbi:MAG: tetratricopeptide repeat protein [Pseudomonadota bacterium]